MFTPFKDEANRMLHNWISSSKAQQIEILDTITSKIIQLTKQIQDNITKKIEYKIHKAHSADTRLQGNIKRLNKLSKWSRNRARRKEDVKTRKSRKLQYELIKILNNEKHVNVAEDIWGRVGSLERAKTQNILNTDHTIQSSSQINKIAREQNSQYQKKH